MTDGLPTDEQLRRIERGVQRRIDLRRAVARRVAGTTAAVALLGGGFALLVPLAMGSGSSGGSAAAPAAGSAASQPVECHASSARDSSRVQRPAPAGVEAERPRAACGATAVDFQSGTGRLSTAAPSTASSGAGTSNGTAEAAPSGSSLTSGSASPSLRGPAVLCVAPDGVLHVFPADERPTTLCARNGMRAR